MAINKNPTDEWSLLAQAAQKGDEKSYHKLLSEIAPYIRNILIPSLSNADAADDVTQEVLISVHKSLSSYGPDRPFKPWLSSIINFRRTDYLRKYYSKKDDQKTSLDNPDYISQNVTDSTYTGELKDIETALEAVPEDHRKIFKMIKIEGYTAKEVANEMGMNESAVKVSAHRTMKKLQGMLK